MNTKSLKKAAQLKNDEFYTKKDTARKLIEPFLDYLKDKAIICPCDNETSEIYLFLKECGLNVENSTCFESVDYSKYDVVVTNPPFSKIEKFMNAINGKKYIIIASGIGPTTLKGQKGLTYGSKSFATDWKNTDKKVMVRFYTNVFNAGKAEKNDTVKDLVLYPVSCLNNTSRTDFTIVNVGTDKLSFRKFIFGDISNLNTKRYRHIANTGIFEKDYTPDPNGSFNILFDFVKRE